MFTSPSLIGSSSVVFDGTSMYVIPTCDFDPIEEELIKTFESFEAAEEFCDEESQYV